MVGDRRRRWPGGGGGDARSVCPVLAAVARRPGALGSPRAVAPRRMTRGRRVLQQWPGSYVSERRPVACAHLVRARAVRACRAIDVRGRPAHVCPPVLCPRCDRAVLSSYLDGESARTTPPTAPAFLPGVSPPVRPCPARSHLVSLRLVRLRPARSRPVRPNPHDAIAHVCIVRARAMRVGCVRLRPARWGVVFVQGFAYVHLVVALVPPPPS